MAASAASRRRASGAASRADFDRDRAVEARRPGEADRLFQDTALAHRPDNRARVRRDEELEHFRADPLAGQAGDREPVADRRAQAFGVERALAEPGGEAKEAQDAQVVLADALRPRRR